MKLINNKKTASILCALTVCLTSIYAQAQSGISSPTLLTSANQSLKYDNDTPSYNVLYRGIDETGKEFETIIKAKRNGNLLITEGDIIVADLAKQGIADQTISPESIIHANPATRWPEGIVPYIGGGIRANLVSQAMAMIEAQSGIRFVLRSTQDNYLKIDDRFNTCASFVGMIGGEQDLFYDRKCEANNVITVEGIAHLLMHAIGFFNEHTRSDRDDFVNILPENITDGFADDFDKTTQPNIASDKYDYNSIMHAFSTYRSFRGEPTIVRIDGSDEAMGNTQLSELDLATLRDMYGTSKFTNTHSDFHEPLNFIPAADNTVQQGFIRLINRGFLPASVTIEGIDDAGQEAASPVSFTIPVNGSTQLNSNVLEFGNTDRGFTGAFGNGTGDWRLNVRSTSPLDISAYMRTTEGFLTQIDSNAESKHGLIHTVPIFNPGSNTNQVSKLRIINLSKEPNAVTIVGTDDSGTNGTTVTFSLAPQSSEVFTAQELENGNADRSVFVGLGDGKGKWRFEITSSQPAYVMSLLEAPGGYLSNLSTSGKNEVTSTNIFCTDIDGARVYGQDIDGTYLGFFGSPDSNDSVYNESGRGSTRLRDGLRSVNYQFSNSTGIYSHLNVNATQPPIAVKNGKALFYITSNPNIIGGHSLLTIDHHCKDSFGSTGPSLQYNLDF